MTGLYPPIAVTTQGAQIRDLYTIVFLIAVVDLLPRRGPDHLDGPALPAQADRRRAPAQTHGNAIAEVVWTVVPTLIVAFLFVISWQTLNSVEVVSAEPQTQDPGHRRAVPVDVRVPADDDERPEHRLHGAHPDR